MSRKTELAKEKRKIRLQNGCCARCGKPNDRIGYYCSECATKHNEYTREARKFYRKYVLSVVKTRCLEVSELALTAGLSNRKDENKSPRAMYKGSKITQAVVKVQGKDIARGWKMASVQDVG